MNPEEQTETRSTQPKAGAWCPTRRALLTAFAVGAVANAFSSGLLRPFINPQGRLESLLAAALRRCLDGQGFADSDFLAFARDAARGRRKPDRREAYLAAAWPVYALTNLLQHSNYSRQLDNWEQAVVTRFLIASDFFHPGRTTEPRYLGLDFPMENPCMVNPFAKRIPINETSSN